ncbi:uncharacterized protein KY384_008960 [Bacidia gigantensis]|uniref:uncharacterized protein n=1 Tax=Bacidia gigantensis TaxID=2732470 RepID=UPI001D0515E9|nr:uncharacterized protein KY384_008960 [Bacidia gigantensis]KAG8525316.1 hypothetical protein KY384_008960 [Bacidia gigantensis]
MATSSSTFQTAQSFSSSTTSWSLTGSTLSTSSITIDSTETDVISTTTTKFVTVTRQQKHKARELDNLEPNGIDVERRDIIRRQNNANTATVPQSLTAFPSSIISAACSLNAYQPTSLPTVTRTTISTVVNTLYQTQPSAYTDQLNTVSSETTVKFGTVTTLVTIDPFTVRNTRTTLTTTTKTETTACIAYATPAVYLSSPTALVGSPSGAAANYDDFSYKLTTPFPLQLEGHELTFEQYVFKGQPQGIYYQVEGTKITFEFYLSHYNDATQYYHYLLIYDTTQPGNVTFKYLQVLDLGASATVGVQGKYLLKLFTKSTLGILPRVPTGNA